MAKVVDGRKVLMQGNFHDFHSRCHGIHEYGNFKTPSELVEKMKFHYEAHGYKVTVKRKSYVFHK